MPSYAGELVTRTLLIIVLSVLARIAVRRC